MEETRQAHAEFASNVTIITAENARDKTIKRAIQLAIKPIPQLEPQLTTAGLTFMTTGLHEIINRLQAIALDMTYQELDGLSTQLSEPFIGGPIETFFYHRQLILTFYTAATGAAMPNHDILRFLIDSLSRGPFSETFAPILSRFNRNFPMSTGVAALANVRTAANLQALITIAYNNLSLSEKQTIATTAAANQASISISGSSPGEVEQYAKSLQNRRPNQPAKHLTPQQAPTRKDRRHNPNPSSSSARPNSPSRPSTTTAAAIHRTPSPTKPSFFCLHHGSNPTHDTFDCIVIKRMSDAERRKFFESHK
jgi:hypothetical protein